MRLSQRDRLLLVAQKRGNFGFVDHNCRKSSNTYQAIDLYQIAIQNQAHYTIRGCSILSRGLSEADPRHRIGRRRERRKVGQPMLDCCFRESWSGPSPPSPGFRIPARMSATICERVIPNRFCAAENVTAPLGCSSTSCALIALNSTSKSGQLVSVMIPAPVKIGVVASDTGCVSSPLS